MKRSDFFKLWIKVLESGEFKQTHGVLVDDNGKYCCLGVACVLANENGEKILFKGKNYLPISMQKLLGINDAGSFKDKVSYRGKQYSDLATMNDAGVRFKTIAKIIVKQLEAKNFKGL